jgi:hypothetical protein
MNLARLPALAAELVWGLMAYGASIVALRGLA